MKLFNKYGEAWHDGIKLSRHDKVINIDWSGDGELLAILQQSKCSVMLWRESSDNLSTIDLSSTQHATFLQWIKCKSHPVLAIGTNSGTLFLYDATTGVTMPILGKHASCITCGAWSDLNLLALGSDDCMITISDKAGDTIHQIELPKAPLDVMFSLANKGDCYMLSINVNGEYLAIFNSDDKKLEEMSVQNEFGCVVTHFWMDEITLVVGMEDGTVCVVHHNPNGITKQICSRLFTANLAHMCLRGACKIAVAGE